MALYVNTNVSALNSQRALAKATNALDTTYKRLSTGLRINSAKDDSAGLQISNRLTVQIDGLYQGNRNANDGIALAQTMEGALDETTSMLQRIRVLAIQAANGTNTTIDRISIQQEVTQLSEEISRIACKTSYGGRQCLAGAGKGILDPYGRVTFQVGAYAYDTLSVGVSTGFTVSGIAEMNTASALNAYNFNTSIKNQTDLKTYLQSHNGTNGMYCFSVTSFDQAQLCIEAIDVMINNVDSKRAELGAIQNRMESTIRNQTNIRENVTDARSRIRDTDYAEETSNLTAQNILQQASQTVLSQANQRPQIALSLLQS